MSIVSSIVSSIDGILTASASVPTFVPGTASHTVFTPDAVPTLQVDREPKPWTPDEAVLNSASFGQPDAEVDVIVVGGGFSGMMAAHNISKAGYSVLVLEARHRIGGRSQTQVLQSQPGAVIEMGAGYINQKTQPTVYALCEKYDLETFAQYDTGDNIRQGFDGEIYRESYETVSCSHIRTKSEPRLT